MGRRLWTTGLGLIAGFVVPLVQVSATAIQPGDWAQFHQGADHTGWNTAETMIGPSNVGTLQVEWSVSDGSSPVVAGGMVFTEDDAGLEAFDSTTGAPIWSFAEGSGLSYRSIPVVADGLVYVQLDHLGPPGKPCRGRLFALNVATGVQVWVDSLGCANGGGPVVAGRLLAAPSNGDVVGINAITGHKRWRFATGGTYVVASTPAISGDLIYASSQDGNLYALDSNAGTEVWHVMIGQGSTPSVADGKVFVGIPGTLLALDAATGDQVWAFQAGTNQFGINDTAAVADSTVYFGSANGRFYAVDEATGAGKWVFNTGTSNVGASCSVAVANGIVYGGADNGTFYALEAQTGSPLWSYPAGNIEAPAVSNGMVFGSSAPTSPPGSPITLYAFGLPG
jgi:outer membrane protein assembly factor BamB